MRVKKIAGDRSIFSRRKSRFGVLAIRMAMPLVETHHHRPGKDSPCGSHAGYSQQGTSRTPAIIVHMDRPSMPCFAMIPATTLPTVPLLTRRWDRPILAFRPAQGGIKSPVTMAHTGLPAANSRSAGKTPSPVGRATKPTVTTTRNLSETNLLAVEPRSGVSLSEAGSRSRRSHATFCAEKCCLGRF